MSKLSTVRKELSWLLKCKPDDIGDFVFRDSCANPDKLIPLNKAREYAIEIRLIL